MSRFLLRRVLAGVFVVGAALALVASPGQAAGIDTPIDSGDTAWMLTATLLVLFMTIPGVALLYGGMVQRKNVLSTVMHSFSAACLCSILWMILGYSLAFTDGGAVNAFVGGFDQFFLKGLTKDAVSGSIPESVFMTFQMTFAIITPALICGAIVERMRFSALFTFLGLWMLLIYAPICHWVWGGGFLGDAGVLDFAGGTVVHINAGVAGLVAAIVIGKRRGYGRESLSPHNLVLSLIGASMLWVGWFGFNAGSALAADSSAGMALAATQIATAAAGLGWLFAEWLTSGKPTVLGIISGAIAGLVAITPASGFVGPTGALIIGLVAGPCCWFASSKLKNRFGYDDPLDVFGIHGVGGLVGALLTGLLAVEAIGGTAGSLWQLWIQFKGVIATVLYCAVGTYVLLLILDRVMGLRVDAQDEIEGLDATLHGETLR